MSHYLTLAQRLMLLAWCLGACLGSGTASSPEPDHTSLRGSTAPERGLRPAATTRCGCDSCTPEVWERLADGYSCGGRIEWVVRTLGRSEAEACRLVGGNEFPSVCGGCDPSSCSMIVEEPSTAPEAPPPSFACGCESCTDEVWNTLAGEYTCGSRIAWLENADSETLSGLGITTDSLDRTGACRLVSEEFPETCFCHPETCGKAGTGSPTASPTTLEPTVSPTRSPTVDPTLSPSTSASTFPTIGEPQQSPAPLPTTEEKPRCGCPSCTPEVLGRNANGFACGGRINWLVANRGASEAEACATVGGEEYPSVCGECNPSTCTTGVVGPTNSPTAMAPTEAPESSPTASEAPACGCPSCTQRMLDRDADGFSCRGRIDWLVANRNLSEVEACAKVGGEEYPWICGACDPATCNDAPAYTVAHLGNSIQYYNDAPRVLEKMLLATTLGRVVDLDYPDRKQRVRSDSCLRGGANIASLWDSGNGMASKFAVRPASLLQDDKGSYDVGAPTVPKLLSKHWDFVVVNDHTQSPVRSDRRARSKTALEDHYLPAIAQTLDDVSAGNNSPAAAATTTVVFLQTMAYKSPVKNSADLGSFDDFTSKLERGYDEYVDLVDAFSDNGSLRATVAPLGRAFQLVRERDYGLWTRLYAYDDFHPSPHGSWLEACLLHCFVTGQAYALLGRDGATMESYWERARRVQSMPLPDLGEARYLNEIAHEVYLERLAKEAAAAE